MKSDGKPLSIQLRKAVQANKLDRLSDQQIVDIQEIIMEKDHGTEQQDGTTTKTVS